MEVCVDSLESAIEAVNGGASRLELCSDLSCGGLSPTTGFLKVVKSLVNIPVFVMLRPRSGDFVYSNDELEIIKSDASALREHGADGFVFGALLEDGSVDIKTCEKLVSVCKPLPITFHRAIDGSRNPVDNVSILIELGFNRVLTSGGKASALEGSDVIAEMINKYGGQIVVMPGGGITKSNLEEILCITGAKEFHGSASIQKQSRMTFINPHFSLGSSSNHMINVCKKENVSKMVTIYADYYNKHFEKSLRVE